MQLQFTTQLRLLFFDINPYVSKINSQQVDLQNL